MKSLLRDQETERLNALGQYNILDTPPEKAFDDLTALASQLCETPIAILMLLDQNRLWVKSTLGLSVTQIPRDHFFCTQAILSKEVFVVRNALADARFTHTPFVTTEPYLHFYAGAPLITPEGYAIGTLCVCDFTPRELNSKQIEALQALSRQVITQLEFRKTLAELAQTKQQNQQLEQQLCWQEQELLDIFENGTGSLHCVDANGTILWVNQAELDLLGYTREEYVGQPIANFHADNQVIENILQRLTRNETLKNYEAKLRCKDGSIRDVLINSNVAWKDDKFSHTRCFTCDITEYKQVEQERDALQATLQRFFNLSIDMLCIAGLDGYFKRMNSACEKTLGYNQQELQSQPFLEFVHPEDQAATLAEVEKLTMGTPTIYFENRYRTKDGSYKWLAWTAFPNLEEGLIYCVGRDITQSKQVEEERLQLLQREQAAHNQITKILESITDAFLALDNEWRFTYLNQQAERLLHRNREQLLGKSVWDEFPEAVSLLFYQEYHRAVTEQVSVEFEAFYAPLNTWFFVHAYPREQGLSVYFEDISVRKRAEAELLETTTLQRAILDSANYTIISTTPDGIIRTFNAAAERLLGYTAEEIIGQVTPSLIHDREEVVQRARELTQELGLPIEPGFECFVAKVRLGTTDEREWTYIRKDGSRFPVLLSITALSDLEGNITGFLGIGSDITERKQAEALLEARVQQQGVIAALGQRALASTDLSVLMDEATRLVAQSLDVEYCKVLELLPDQHKLLLRSEVGWNPELIGWATIGTQADSQAGYTLMTQAPVIVEDLSTETRFRGSDLLLDHGVVSGLSVIIPGLNRPFGVLGAHTQQQRTFTQEHIHFMQTVANVMATAMERHQAQEELQRQHQRSQLFAEITLKIRQSLQLEEILQTTVTEIQNILQVDRVLLYRVWPNGTGCTVTEAVQPGWSKILGISFAEEVFPLEYQELYRQGQVRAIADVQQAYAEVTPCLLDFLQPWGVKAKLVVPILVSEDYTEQKITELGRDFTPPSSPSPRLWGLLIAHHCSSPRQWTNFEIELLQQLSEQIGLALTQAQLLQRETRQRMELTRSNAELQEFAYVASHDLQEPLRKIQAFGDRLMVKYSEVLTDQGCDYLKRMQNAAERMQALIDDLLMLSRITTRAQPFVPTNLKQVVQDVLSDLEVRIQQTDGRIELGELPTLEADPVQMRQLLQNLISNSLKFHRNEEPPMIKIYSRKLLAQEWQPQERINRSAGWQIFVEDNGIGFDEKYLDRIFNAFQRLHGRSEYEGTGMGLAICRKIAERHNGKVDAQSIPGSGSIFRITLPLQPHQGDTAT